MDKIEVNPDPGWYKWYFLIQNMVNFGDRSLSRQERRHPLAEKELFEYGWYGFTEGRTQNGVEKRLKKGINPAFGVYAIL
jgi:hypothetical protein